MCRPKISMLLGVILSTFAASTAGLKGRDDGVFNIQGTRGSRLLPLFTVLKFPHDICTVGDNTGTCFGRKECRRQGGKLLGSCAKGYGVCCKVSYDASNGTANVRINGSTISNPSRLSDGGVYLYKLRRPASVCQVKLDFKEFIISNAKAYNLSNLLDPQNHACIQDKLSLVGSSNANTLGALCGNLTGQSIYLEYGTSTEITILIYIQEAMGQSWNIGITYIKCDSLERAPPGCLQYFTGVTGRVTSFNWSGNEDSRQLLNQDYSICVKKMPGMNKITWDACDPMSFCVDNFCHSPDSLSGNSCFTDWVMIFGLDRFCGAAFEPRTTTSQPFLLGIHFDEKESGALLASIGFCLTWSQSP